MKFIVVTLLFIFAERSYGIPAVTKSQAPTRKLPYELPGENLLDIHSLKTCGDKKSNGVPIRAWMGPCWNTEQCQIPHCCGIISGRNSTFRIEYKATTTFSNGIYNGKLAGFAFGKEADGSDCTPISLPFQVFVPPTFAGYSPTLCDQTTCPQISGNIYTVNIKFRFVTTAATTLGIIADFVAEILTDKKEKALCYGLWATLENPDLGKSAAAVVSDIVTLDVLDNPIETAAKLLPGILPDYNPPINLKTNLLGANFLKSTKN